MVLLRCRCRAVAACKAEKWSVVLSHFQDKGRAAIVNAPESKPTLQDIRAQQYFDPSELAEKAGVTISTIDAMLNGQPVRRLQAELVLDALSEFTGKEYSLEIVSITLAPEEGEQES
jgi:transcriptional regulator with XRE-family HTH domain